MVKIKKKVQIRDKVSVSTNKTKNVRFAVLILGGLIILIVAGYFIFREKPGSELVVKDSNAEQVATDVQQQNASPAKSTTTGSATIDTASNLNKPVEGQTKTSPGKDGETVGNTEKTTVSKSNNSGKPSSGTTVNIPYKKGETYKVYQFPFGSGMFTQPDPDLDKLVDVLKKNPTVRISISAYTDKVGSGEYNLKLSERRAKAIFDYIASKGIDVKRLSFQGKGISNKYPTDEENRRAEFVLTE